MSLTVDDGLVDGALVGRWLAWGFVWLLVFPTVGALVSAARLLDAPHHVREN